MNNITINGNTISYINQNIKSIYEFNNSFESMVSQIEDIALETYCDISLEDNEYKTHSTSYNIIRYILNLLDNFYKWLVSFVKKIIDFFKRIIKIITGRTGPQDVKIEQNQDFIIVTGKVGLVNKNIKIPLEEFDRIVGLSNQNGDITMVRYMDQNTYLNIIQKYTNEICSLIDDPSIFFDESSSEVLNKLSNDVKVLKEKLFINTSNRQDVIKNLALFGKNPDNYAKDVSIKVLNLTKRIEVTEKRLLEYKKSLESANNTTDSDLSKSGIQNLTKALTFFKTFDNIILNSSAGITKISFEFMTMFSRETSTSAVANVFAYMDRSIHVSRNGTDNYTINLKNIVLDGSFIPENDLKIIIDEGRAINSIVNDNKGQVIDKETGEASSENEHVINFMNLLKKYSRKVKAVIGASGTNKFVIYNFDIKIKQDKSGKEFVVVNGEFINDNRKKLESIPNILYHTSNMPGLKELMPSAGNVSTGNLGQSGIHGIGINSKRIYASKTPVVKQGFSVMSYIDAIKNAFKEIEFKVKGKINPQSIAYAKQLEASKYANVLSNLYIYKIDSSALKGKDVYVDPEHHGGLSGKANSILTGGKDVVDNLVYIETNDPIPVTEITDEVIDKLKNNSEYPTVKRIVEHENLDKLKFMFK